MPEAHVAATEPEPWLRGPLAGVHPLWMPVLFSFAQVREDLAKHTAGLGKEALWKQLGKSSLGFHLKHMAGSVDRLTTYLEGKELSEEQLADLENEATASGTLPQLLSEVDRALTRSAERLQALDPNTLYATRTVGRRALPTSVLGLIVHLCEHTQRHLGQAITLAQWLKQQQT